MRSRMREFDARRVCCAEAWCGKPAPYAVGQWGSGALGMRRVFQDLKTGETRLAQVPRPGAGLGRAGY